MEQTITKTRNERKFRIDRFIEFLEQEKAKGATHLKFWVTPDPMWRFEWVETFRIKSDQEIKQEEITKLENRLKELKKIGIMNTINLEREIKLLKQQQAVSIMLLKSAKSQCGMMLGEEIESHLAELTGTHFNSKEYHMERLPGEQ